MLHTVKELSAQEVRVLYLFMQHCAKMYSFENGVPFALKQWNLFAAKVRDSQLGDDCIILIDALGMEYESPVWFNSLVWLCEYKEICDWYIETNKVEETKE